MKEALKRRRAHGLDLTIVLGHPGKEDGMEVLADRDELEENGDNSELAPEIKDEKGAAVVPAEDDPHAKMAAMLKGGSLGMNHLLKHKK